MSCLEAQICEVCNQQQWQASVTKNASQKIVIKAWRRPELNCWNVMITKRQYFNYYHIRSPSTGFPSYCSSQVEIKTTKAIIWLEMDVSAHLYVLLTKPLRVSYHLINVPSNICECCIMNASNKAKWSCLLSVIQQDWIQSCHCKHHAVWQTAIMFYFMSVQYISNNSNNGISLRGRH